MAGSFCDYVEDKCLDIFFGNASNATQVLCTIDLSTTTPTDAGGNVTVPTDASYAAVSVTNNLTTWAPSSGGSKHNDIAFTFPTFTTASALVTHFIVKDGSANCLCWGSLTNSKTIDIGDTASFAIGAMVITLT